MEELLYEKREEDVEEKRKKKKRKNVLHKEEKSVEVGLYPEKIALSFSSQNNIEVVQKASIPESVKEEVKRKFFLPPLLDVKVENIIPSPPLPLISLKIGKKEKETKRKFFLPSIPSCEVKREEILPIPLFKFSKKGSPEKRKFSFPPISNGRFENISPSPPLKLIVLKIKREESKNSESEKKVQAEIVVGSGEGGIGIEENLLDILFERRKYGEDIGEVREPYIIFIFSKNEKVKEIVKSILQRYIEEMEESFEGFKEITIGEKGGNEKKEERRIIEIEEDLDVERKVFIVNLKKLESIDRIDETSLTDRINELKGKRLGFLIFYIEIEKEKVDLEKLIEEFWDKIKEKIKNISYSPNIQIWKIEKSAKSERIERIIGRILGFETKTLKRYLEVWNFDKLFEIGKKFQKIKRKEVRDQVSEIVRRSEESESDLHYDLKCLTVYYLIKNRLKDVEIRDIEEKPEKIAERIKVEENLEGNKNIVPDIWIKEGTWGIETWEIETLFAEGVRAGKPLKKIDETIEKYYKMEMMESSPEKKDSNSKGKVSKINIILDNLTFYLHLKEIKRKEKFWKKRLGEKKIELEFWIPDWENFALVPISKEIEEIKKILSALKGKEP